MKNKKISHSKVKNTGALFELLVRQITADTLSGRPHSEAMNIMKKYFSASTELGKEMQLYRAFFDGSRLTETKAIHFLDLVVTQRKKLNERKLMKEKYELIKEIGRAYPLKEFLSCKLPDYIIHASIYKTFTSEAAEQNSVGIVNFSEIANARFTLIEHLSGKAVKPEIKHDSELIKEFRQQSEEMRLLTYKLMVDKFNQKYTGLNDKQKELLREFINNVANTNSLTRYVKAEIPVVRQKLQNHSTLLNDKVTTIKINEVISQLNAIAEKRVIKDREVTAMMIVYEILKEMTNE